MMYGRCRGRHCVCIAYFLCAFFIVPLRAGTTEKMRLYAFYSPSHEVLLKNWFLPSIQDDFEVIIEKHEQECLSANYMSAGWKKAVSFKVGLIRRAIEENWGKVFLYSDVDVQFLAPAEEVLRKAIEGFDMVIQRDSPKGDACSGFFACVANEKTRALWAAMEDLMAKTPKNVDDQGCLNILLKARTVANLKWKFLSESFFGGGTFQHKGWRPGLDLYIPADPIMHHANFTVGIANKVAQLQYVKAKVAQRQLASTP